MPLVETSSSTYTRLKNEGNIIPRRHSKNTHQNLKLTMLLEADENHVYLINCQMFLLSLIQCMIYLLVYNASFRSDYEKLTWNIACCTENVTKPSLAAC